jgi:hypothetical protein
MPSLGPTMSDISGKWAPSTKMAQPRFQTFGIPRSVPKPDGSELFDRGFRLQQDRNSIANRVHSFALVALQGLFATQYQGLAAHRTGKYFQQFW